MNLISKWSPRAAIEQARERLRQSPLAHRLAKGAAWSLIGAVSSRVLTLASSVIIVRLLGKETVGEFGMLQSTLAMLGTFAGLGLGMTATKHTAELRTRDPDRAGRVIGVTLLIGLIGGLAMTAASWAASDWLADRVLDRPSLVPYLRFSSILVLIGVVDGVFNSGLVGFESFARIARISIHIAVVNLLITLPLVYWFGLYGAVSGLVISTGLHMILAGIALSDECRAHGVAVRIDRASGNEWRTLVHYSLPALGATILVIPASWLANVILVNSGYGYASMGSLNVVNQLRALAMYLPMLLVAPTFAVLANIADDPTSVRKTLRYAIGLSALATLPLAVVVAALGKYILVALYGAAYAEDGLTLALAMIVVAIQATGAALGTYIQAIGRMWFGLAINLLWAVAFVGLSMVWIPRFGPAGYMASMAVAYVAMVAIAYGYLWNKSPELMKCYPLCSVLILFGLLMPLAIYVSQRFDLLTSGLIALVMGGGLAGVLVVPLARLRSIAVPPSSVEASRAIIGGDE